MVWISIVVVAWLIMIITLGGVIQVLWEIKKELGNRPAPLPQSFTLTLPPEPITVMVEMKKPERKNRKRVEPTKAKGGKDGKVT
ncbi:MAG: hypothetical protein HYT46_01815 [Candidatus Vogelbacteria bacterium]|nr:hypothetical protein [Candidatus Vogelbacteria bacterium]